MGIIFSIGAVEYGIGNLGHPGPGFLPLLAGGLLIVLSSLHLFFSLVKKGKVEIEQIEQFFPEKDSLKKKSLALFGLFAYGILLEPLGYGITTFLFMIFILKFVGSQRWITAFLGAFLVCISSYILFVYLLKAQMPTGILAF
jgi:putative tricarboxylic transport membrane protein